MRPTVNPSGSPRAPLAIFGGRPDWDETQSHMGFTGPSGQLLWNLAKNVGIHRDSCYVSNIRKDYSQENPMPTRAEIEEALPELQAELAGVSSNLILALGEEPLYALTGKTGITNYRGSILPSREIFGSRKVLASVHPATCLYTRENQFASFTYRWLIQADLKRAARHRQFPDFRYLPRNFLYDPRPDEAVDFIRKFGQYVAVDIETFGDRISCFALSDDPTRAICIPFVGGSLSATELVPVIREVDHVLRTREVEGQNVQFDTTRLERIRLGPIRISWDTMLWHHLRWTELGNPAKRNKRGGNIVDEMTGAHNLGFIVSWYCDGEPYYKDQADRAWTAPGLTLEQRFHEYWEYNMLDAARTRQAAQLQRLEAENWGQKTYFTETVIPMIRPIMEMQNLGMCIDWETLEREKTRINLETAVLQQRLNHDPRVGFECNVKSGPQLGRVLEQVEWKGIRRTAKGNIKADKETLTDYAYDSPHADLFQLVLDVRSRRDLSNGFYNLETDTDGRYKAAYLLHGTAADRLSSRAFRQGPQLQNIPERARRIFKPADGCGFLSRDLSKADPTVVAYDSEDEGLIDLFADPTRDVYKEVAAMVMGIPIDQVTPSIRQLFKSIVNACNYGMKWKKFMQTLRTPRAGSDPIYIQDLDVPGGSPAGKAKYVLDAYHARFPGPMRRFTRIAQSVVQTRTITGALGRKRWFAGPIYGSEADETFRAAASWEPQHIAGGIANRAVRTMVEKGYRVVSQVHDSVMIEVPIPLRDQADRDLEAAITISIPMHGRTMTIRSEAKWSTKSWGDLESFTREVA